MTSSFMSDHVREYLLVSSDLRAISVMDEASSNGKSDSQYIYILYLSLDYSSIRRLGGVLAP